MAEHSQHADLKLYSLDYLIPISLRRFYYIVRYIIFIYCITFTYIYKYYPKTDIKLISPFSFPCCLVPGNLDSSLYFKPPF